MKKFKWYDGLSLLGFLWVMAAVGGADNMSVGISVLYLIPGLVCLGLGELGFRYRKKIGLLLANVLRKHRRVSRHKAPVKQVKTVALAPRKKHTSAPMAVSIG